MGTNLKYLCGVARKAFITKDPLFSLHDRSIRLTEISELRGFITNHWCNDISSLANKVLNEKKWTKPKLLPLTEVIQTFKNYVGRMVDDAYQKTSSNECDFTLNYKTLAECTLSLLLVFNRKRIEEIQFLDIPTYERTSSSASQQECLMLQNWKKT